MMRALSSVAVAAALLGGYGEPTRATRAMGSIGALEQALPRNLVAEVRAITPPGVTADGPHSPGVLAGDFLYVSGQDGRDAAGRLPDSVEGQVRQALRGLQGVVEAAGLTLAHVAYCHVYLTDMADHETLDRVWREAFPQSPPARAVVGVHGLPGGGAVQINAVAYRDLATRTPIVPPGASQGRPWSPGIMAGSRLFLSGSLGTDDAAGRVPADPDAQAQVALDGMRQVLVAAGLDFRHVVFVNPYMTDTASRRMNDIYARHFEFGNTPARATISVASLPGGASMAFTGVAIADLSRRRAYRPANMRPSATASPCVMADDTYYCSAKGPFTPGPARGPAGLQGIWVETIEAQVRQTMRNLLDGLEEAGLSLSDVVATHVYLDDMRDLARLDRIYAQYFPTAPPARTTIAQRAPVDRTTVRGDTYPGLEQISLIAVRRAP